MDFVPIAQLAMGLSGLGLIFLGGFGYVVGERAKIKDMVELRRTAGIVAAGIALVVVAVLI